MAPYRLEGCVLNGFQNLTRSSLPALDLVAQPVWIFSRASLAILASNAAAQEWLGYGEGELDRRTILDIRPENEHREIQQRLTQFPNGPPRPDIWTFIAKSGARYPAQATWKAALFDGSPAILATIMVVQSSRDPGAGMPPDAEVRLEKLSSSLAASQEREARLRVAAKLLELGSWECEVASQTMNWSPRAFEIHGVELKEGTPDFDKYIGMVHPDDRQQLVAAFQGFARSHSRDMVFQYRWVRSNGTISHIKAVGQQHRIDGKDIIQGFAQDVSEIAEAHIRLSEVASVQRIAGRAARLGGWRRDFDTGRTIWSPELAAIFEQPEPMSAGFQHLIKYYVPEHRDVLSRAIAACRESGRPFDETLQIMTAQGSRMWVRSIGEAVRDAHGRIVAIEGACQDISELMAARGEAEALSHRLKQTLERISDGFYLLDDNWRISFLNHKAAALLQRGRDELLGEVVWDQFPEATGNSLQDNYERALEQGERVRFQRYYPPLETWFEIDAHPTPEGLAVYFRDITQERRRTEQLRLLEAAVSRQNDILLITEAGPVAGPEGPRIVYVNDAFVKRTGYSREEAIGQTPRILQGPNTQRDELHRIRQALEKWRPVRAELINYTKLGEEFWLELDIVPLADEAGQYTHWVAIQRDVTDRKRAESKIRLNEMRFRLLAKATNDVVWDWSLTQDTVWWNEGLTSHFGYDLEQMAAPPGFWTNSIHPEDKDRVLESVSSAISGHANNWSSEYRFLHADGHPITVVGRGFVIRDGNGKSVRMVGSMTDVTHQRDMEAKLRQSQKLEAVGQLTGGIAHDFNNILTIILGNSEILSEELSDQRELCQLAEMIATAAERGAELTNRLLAFARKQALEPSLLDVNALIASLESLLQRTLGAQIDVKVICASGLWLTEIDAGQLEGAMLNLAINARDAMENSGCLIIETANATLDEDYVAAMQDVTAGQYVAITITDTGHGIPHDLLDRIFEPFYTTKELGQGTGLGLSMVYGFVRQSGGHIRVYSEPGEGTSVKLYFPRALRKGSPKPVSKPRKRLVGGNESILVVEDDILVCEHLTSQLEALGYRVTSTNSGAQALEILQAAPDIDLLFTDVVMPGGLSGQQLADRALSLHPGLKVLFTSGYTKNAIAHNGKLKLTADLLGKPYTREQLATKVRKALDQ